MQAIERFFSTIFGPVLNRITHTLTNTAEQKIRGTMENQYDRTFTPREKAEGDRNG
jgi:hypothetical protein